MCRIHIESDEICILISIYSHTYIHTYIHIYVRMSDLQTHIYFFFTYTHMYFMCRCVHTWIETHICIYVWDLYIIYIYIYVAGWYFPYKIYFPKNLRIYVRGSRVHQLNGAYFEFSVLKFRLTPILFHCIHCSWVSNKPVRENAAGTLCYQTYELPPKIHTNQQNSGAHFVMSSSADRKMKK